MAKSSIADVYAAILPSVDGITNSLKTQFQDFADFAGLALERGITQGVQAGASNIGTALNATAQNAQQDFQNIMTGLSIPASITQDFTQLAQAAGQDMQTQLAAGITGAMSQPLPTLTASQTAPAITAPVTTSTQTGVVAGFSNAGPKILGLIAALGIGKVVSDSIGSALETEKGNTKMVAALGLSPEAAKKAGEAAGNLYNAAYGESMNDVQTATRAVLSSFSALQSGSTADIEKVTARALNMAEVFEVDVSRAMQVSSQMVTTGWAGDAVGALDLLSASMSKVPDNLKEDVMDAVDEYGPFMKTLGLEGVKGMELLVKGASKGMYGIDKVGDSLKEFTIRATDMSTASGVGYEALGLNQEEMSAKLLAGGETATDAFQTIVKGLSSIEDPVKQQTAALALFGTPLEDLSVNEIPSFLESLQSTAGGLGDVTAQAEAMDKALSNDASSAITEFKRTIETSFANAILPLIKELQPQLKLAGEWFKNNQDRISEWVRVIAVSIQSTLVPVIQTLLPYVQALFSWLAENEAMLKAWVPRLTDAALGLTVLWAVVKGVTAVSAMITVIRAAATAFYAAAAASTIFGLSIAWLPLIAIAVFAVGLAIGTALYQLITNFDAVWGAIKGFFTGIWSNLQALGSGAYSIMGMIGGAILGIGALIANGIIGLINLIPYAINAMLMAVNGIGGALGMDWNIGMLPTIPYIDFSIPALATGADIMGPTVALVGEKDPETVVNRGKMNTLIDNVNTELMGQPDSAGGDTYIEVNVTGAPMDTPETLAQKVASAVAYQQKR